ncbi:MAG TPA: hypothetical protein ENG87_04800, partial [Candidatus Pacearchaeota archaeon]|nr:hypothetical protein [Candidatus Pacearchaeota archaeon]
MSYQILKKVGKAIRNTFITGLVLANFIPGIAKAEEIKQEKIMPDRKIVLDIADPTKNFEANANAWYSANQIIGKGSDLLGVKAGLDNTLLGRIGLLGLSSALSHHLTHASHEFGHIRVGEKIGSYEWRFEPNSIFALDNNWTKTLNKHPTDNQGIRKAVAGLNQNEYNAYVLFKNNKNQLTPDNAFSFLSTKTWDIGYNLGTSYKVPTESNDVDNYIRFLNKKGIPAKKSDHLTQAILADALSIQTWDSFRAISNYLKTGNRVTKPTVFKWGETEFTPPLINLYLTHEGGFFNTTSIVNPEGEHPIEVNLGYDADFIGGGRVNTMRIGGQYNNIRLADNLRLSPGAHINLERKSLEPKGFSAGAELEWKINNKSSIIAGLKYNQKDIMENIIKEKDRGYD